MSKIVVIGTTRNWNNETKGKKTTITMWKSQIFEGIICSTLIKKK